MMTTSDKWEIPPKIWGILLSWGIGALVLAGLLSFWIATNEREAARERDRLAAEQAAKAAQVQIEQDRAMCSMIGIFLVGPEPLPGPAGERSRVVREGMSRYRATLRCEQIGA